MEFLNGKKLSSQSSLDDFERRVGITFPALYRSVASEKDGASLEPSLVTVWNPVLGRDQHISCDALIPFEEDGNGEPTMVEVNFEFPNIPDGVIAFGTEAGGYLFGFDYRAGPEPSIVLLHFGDMSDDGSSSTPVARSFDEFLAGLQPRPDHPEVP